MTISNKTRRRFLQATGAAVVGALSAPYIIRSARADSKELVFVGFGGSYQDGQTKAYFEPFERETGIKVTQTSGVEIAKLRAQVQAGHVEWDLATLPDRLLFAATEENLLTPLDYGVINTADIQKSVVRKYSLGHISLAMALTYSTSFYKPGTEPKNWQDFWNLASVPGIRGLFNNPAYSLEIALVADGVPKDKLYPLDVERALKSLDRIKSKVIWWDQFPQPGVMLQSGEITMTPWTRGASFHLEGQPIAVSFDGAIASYENWTVPKDAPHADAAMKFIDFAMKPERQAALTKYVAFGPTNAKAWPLVDPKVAPWLASYPEYHDKEVQFDGDWWGRNLAKVSEKWDEWRLSK
ncbi:MAG TPA: extracellular solute-binding protein [Stellaceae bacterium]|nr:extracellular solute-binding protein [Stellaceae bacterium]